MNLKRPSDIAHSRPFISMQQELNRIMHDFKGWFESFDLPSENRLRFEEFMLTPRADVIDEKDKIQIKVELPGMTDKDVQVSIENGLLEIKGKKTFSEEDKNKGYITREISYGCYERRIPLPETVDTEKAHASFKNGLLIVDLPKNPASIRKSRPLEIETG